VVLPGQILPSIRFVLAKYCKSIAAKYVGRMTLVLNLQYTRVLGINTRQYTRVKPEYWGANTQELHAVSKALQGALPRSLPKNCGRCW
jgi:hypothetical protein